MGQEKYETPTLSDYGDLQDLTASNNVPAFVDVPEGTPVDPRQSRRRRSSATT